MDKAKGEAEKKWACLSNYKIVYLVSWIYFVSTNVFFLGSMSHIDFLYQLTHQLYLNLKYRKNFHDGTQHSICFTLEGTQTLTTVTTFIVSGHSELQNNLLDSLY